MMAIKVLGGAVTKAVQTSGRKLMGGAAIPIAIIDDDDPRPTVAGAAIPLQILEAGDRPMMGGAALPVRIVESAAGPVMAGAAMPAIVVQGSLWPDDWLVGYSYRKRIPITGQAGAGTDYQVELEVRSGPGADGPGVVYLNNHCSDFPCDIRFTDDDGMTELDHWLEPGTGSPRTFWIEIADDLGSNQAFYIYYGSVGIASASDGNAAFDFFDDFNLKTAGAWSWFSDPRAIRYVGTHDKTYWGWVATNGDIKISSYDHKTKEVAVFTLKAALGVDDHENPAILIRNDGKLVVFYTRHGLTPIYYRISTNAEDISAWAVEKNISPVAPELTYLCPIQLSAEGNKIYLFFRGGNLNKWSYVTSIDGGENFSAATTLIDIGVDTNYHQYLKIESNNVDKIYFAHSGHPMNETTSVYFFYYHNGSYYKADDTLIAGGLPLDRADMSLVYDASADDDAWIWDIAVSGSTYYIVFATFPLTTDHRYDYARWTGVAWDINQITPAGGFLYVAQPYYSGGISLDHETPNVVYLSRVISGEWEIQKWSTPDGGSSWDAPVNITSGSSKKNIRPVVIRNHALDVMAFWMWGDYFSYINYDTTILVSSPEEKWTVRQGTAHFHEHALNLVGTVGARALLDGKTLFSYPKALELRGKAAIANTANCHFCAMRAPNDWTQRGGDLFGNIIATQIKFQTFKDGSFTETVLTVLATTNWHIYKVIWELNKSRAYQDDTLEATHVTDVATRRR